MSSPTPMTVYDGCISRERMSRDWPGRFPSHTQRCRRWSALKAEMRPAGGVGPWENAVQRAMCPGIPSTRTK
jgi:hypothetical protein